MRRISFFEMEDGGGGEGSILLEVLNLSTVSDKALFEGDSGSLGEDIGGKGGRGRGWPFESTELRLV